MHEYWKFIIYDNDHVDNYERWIQYIYDNDDIIHGGVYIETIESIIPCIKGYIKFDKAKDYDTVVDILNSRAFSIDPLDNCDFLSHIDKIYEHYDHLFLGDFINDFYTDVRTYKKEPSNQKHQLLTLAGKCNQYIKDLESIIQKSNDIISERLNITYEDGESYLERYFTLEEIEVVKNSNQYIKNLQSLANKLDKLIVKNGRLEDNRAYNSDDDKSYIKEYESNDDIDIMEELCINSEDMDDENEYMSLETENITDNSTNIKKEINTTIKSFEKLGDDSGKNICNFSNHLHKSLYSESKYYDHIKNPFNDQFSYMSLQESKIDFDGSKKKDNPIPKLDNSTYTFQREVIVYYGSNRQDILHTVYDNVPAPYYITTDIDTIEDYDGYSNIIYNAKHLDFCKLLSRIKSDKIFLKNGNINLSTQKCIPFKPEKIVIISDQHPNEWFKILEYNDPNIIKIYIELLKIIDRIEHV